MKNAVYVGFDPAEERAYRVAVASCIRHTAGKVQIHPLDADDLYDRKLLWRPVERRQDGQMIDHLSGAAQSTSFATSRFLIPSIQRTGWALFVDSDVVFLADVDELFAQADPRYAVMCVQHHHGGTEGTKKVGMAQIPYPRKNWSSVMLWNCDHPANLRLTLGIVNWWPGAILHRLAWLRDEEVGQLPAAWNWLVGVQPRPEAPKLAHFTLGGPWLAGWPGAEHDELWLDAER